MKSNAGQVLPFCMMLVCIALWILFSNFEISFLNLRKIQDQKKLDNFALDHANITATSLNALAAYNYGLALIAQRTYLVVTTEAALMACVAETGLLVSPCVKPLAKLTAQLPEFYRKLHRLGNDMVKQQDRIGEWAHTSTCAMQTAALGGTPSFVPMSFQLYPNLCGPDWKQKLPYYRPISTLLQIPAPLEFKQEFLQEKNKVLVLGATSIDSPLKKPNYPSELPKYLWSMSEVKIEGEDFQNMEFEPRLHHVSMQDPLWNEKAPASYLVHRPSLREIRDDIHH